MQILVIVVLKAVFFKIHVNCFLALAAKQCSDHLWRSFQAQSQLKRSLAPFSSPQKNALLVSLVVLEKY